VPEFHFYFLVRRDSEFSPEESNVRHMPQPVGTTPWLVLLKMLKNMRYRHGTPIASPLPDAERLPGLG
jgi:hypothetical protein